MAEIVKMTEIDEETGFLATARESLEKLGLNDSQIKSLSKSETFLYQLNEENENMEIMVDFEKREIITLKELMPNWWGKERYAEAASK